MRRIKFEYQHGHGEHNKETEFIEYEDDVTNAEIQEEFEVWVWGFIADKVYWGDAEK